MLLRMRSITSMSNIIKMPSLCHMTEQRCHHILYFKMKYKMYSMLDSIRGFCKICTHIVYLFLYELTVL